MGARMFKRARKPTLTECRNPNTEKSAVENGAVQLNPLVRTGKVFSEHPNIEAYVLLWAEKCWNISDFARRKVLGHAQFQARAAQ